MAELSNPLLLLCIDRAAFAPPMAQSPARCASMALLFAFLLTAQAATAQQAQPALSRSPDQAVGAVPADDEATMGQAVVSSKPTVGSHSVLVPYEQCGGERGLCNTTTIGVPCGDHPWGLECPTGYACQRKTQALWQCYPVLGKKDSADEGPTRFTTAPKGSEADNPRQVVVPVSNATGLGSSASSKHDSSSSSSNTSSTGTSATTPEVRSCPPGTIAVGSSCFRSSASSRKGVAGTLAGSAGLLACWQLAVVLLTALLA